MTEMKLPLPCLICGRELESAWPEIARQNWQVSLKETGQHLATCGSEAVAEEQIQRIIDQAGSGEMQTRVAGETVSRDDFTVLRAPDDPPSNQPYAGTSFVSHGHYGSTVFDPMAGGERFLEINVCDQCLQKPELTARVAYVVSFRRRAEHDYQTWDPNDPKQSG